MPDEDARPVSTGDSPSARLPTDPAWLPAAASTRLAVATTLGGLALSVWMAILSDGVHHDDDLVHFQMAAWSVEYPQYLLHEWGRPGFTALYALPAQLGWTAARILSGLLTALTGWLAYRIAVRQRIALAGLVPALLWLQPMTFTLSYTTLTEPVLAFYLTLAVWLLLRGNHGWSAAAVSLCMLTRYEGALFVGLLAAALWMKRARVRHWIWIGWAPLAHNVLGFIFLGKLPLLVFLDAAPTDEYGAGGWLSMFARWPLASGIGLIVLACAGVQVVWRSEGGKLWITCGAAYLLAHSLIYHFGLFASGGYYRFLVPLGPILATTAAAALSVFWAALLESRREFSKGGEPKGVAQCARAAAGALLLLWLAVEIEAPDWLQWALVFARIAAVILLAACAIPFALRAAKRRWARSTAIAACPAIMLAVAIWQPLVARGVEPPYHQCGPLVLVDDQILIRDATDWLRSQGLQDRSLVAANAWVHYFLNKSQAPDTPWATHAIEMMNPGDLFVWDARYCPSPAYDIFLDDVRGRADLVERWHGREHPNGRDGVYWYVFEKRAVPTTSPGSKRSG